MIDPQYWQGILILGAGGFAREVALVYRNQTDPNGTYGRRLFYSSDDTNQKDKYYEVDTKCLGSIETAAALLYAEDKGANHLFVPGIGSPAVKKMLVERAIKVGLNPISLVSKQANVSFALDALDFWYHSELGKGTVVCAGVSSTVNVKVGNYVNVNLSCTLGHDCVIEDYVNLSPSVNVSGHVYIESGADVGTGAVLLPGVRIGRNAIVGAGSVVTKDVEPDTTVVGVPAKPINKKS